MSEAHTSQGKAWLSYGGFLLPLLVLYPGYADLYASYQIFLALATLPLLIWLWRKEERLPLERPAAILIGLIFAGYVISVWRNGALPSSAGWRFFFLGVCLLLTYAVGLWATTRDQAWQIALAGLWGAHLLLCLQLWVHFAFFSADVTNWRLAVPGVFHLRHLGFGLSLALVAGFACLHHLLKKDWRQAAGLCLLLTIFASVLLWSGSRAGLLACAGGLAVFFLLARKDTLLPSLSAVVLVFVLGGLLTSVYPTNADGNGLARLLRGGESTMQGSALQRVSTGRTDMWTDAAERFTARPLTGFGVDQYQRLDGLRSRVQEPHNSWILLWFEGGLIALCAMAILAGLWFLRLWCARSSPVVQTLLALGVALGLLSLVDSVHYWVTSLILMAYLGGVGWAYGQAWPRTQVTSIPRPVAWLVTVVIAALSGWGLWQEQVLSDPTLKPTDTRLAWIRPMPLSHWYFLTHLQGWEQRHELTYPELNAWYDWLVAKGETPWFFQIQHAYVQARVGETAAAIAGLEEGLRDAPSAIRRETQAQHEPALNQLKARLAYEQAQP